MSEASPKYAGTDKVCIVAGVGPGTGAALSRRFAAGGYRVAMLARDAGRLATLERDIAGSRGYTCDVTDAAQVKDVAARIVAELGTPAVLVHNAVSGQFGEFLQVSPEDLERTFRTNVLSLMLLGQAIVPGMLSAGGGAIMVTGNTSAWRGSANFAAFAPSKAAQRILAQSMARSLGPQGIHVAYVVIDAVIDVPWTRQAFASRPDEFFARPDAIAETVFHVAHQERAGWTFEVDLRPFGEKW
jgi:NAD(P)-dependent dehydrogenase (short-subunit alcohol dehydrogenase family)